MSTSWKASVPMRARGTWPVMQITGTESSLASARAVRVLVAPGPEVAKKTAGRPVVRAMPWAMKPAPCSCRARTWRMAVLRDRASYRGRLAPPGIPAMQVTPWRSNRRMTSSAPDMCSMASSVEPLALPARSSSSRGKRKTPAGCAPTGVCGCLKRDLPATTRQRLRRLRRPRRLGPEGRWRRWSCGSWRGSLAGSGSGSWFDSYPWPEPRSSAG